MLVLKGLVGLHRTVQLQLLQLTGWGTDLDYCDIEWFALEANRDHSVIFDHSNLGKCKLKQQDTTICLSVRIMEIQTTDSTKWCEIWGNRNSSFIFGCIVTL